VLQLTPGMLPGIEGFIMPYIFSPELVESVMNKDTEILLTRYNTPSNSKRF